MKIVFVVDDERHAAKLPYAGCLYVEVARCPAGCAETPCKVAGSGISRHDHDTYYAPGRTLCCGARGELQTQMSTIFGIEEDSAVLNGRPRVY